MKKYNAQDVRLLEAVYKKLLPYIDNHPHLGVLMDAETACRNCGGSHITKRGTRITATGKRQTYQCNDCGAWMSGPVKKVTDIR